MSRPSNRSAHSATHALVALRIREYGINQLARDLGVRPGTAHNWVLKGIPLERGRELEVLLDMPKETIFPGIYKPLAKREVKRLQGLRARNLKAKANGGGA